MTASPNWDWPERRSATRRALAAGVGLALWCAACGGTSADSEPLSESEIGDLLAHWVDERHKSVGVVAGVVSQQERFIVGHGRLAADDPRQPDGDTVFEIGSITKVFTSTLLADLVLRGELALDTPVQSLLGDEARMPTRGGAEITLGQLATHSSGLPRLPDNLDPADETNPYADYTVERLYEFLGGHELSRDIGETVEYSNLGYGLLGHSLGRGQGRDYETLVKERILEPLQMSDTAATLTPTLRERLAAGHDGSLKPAANWDLAVHAGAGALLSTVKDLLTFLEANLGLRESPLREAMEHAHAPRVEDQMLGMEIGLGWIVHDSKEGRIVWHNGGTGGYSSFIGFDPESQVGVVVLSNTADPVDSLGFRLLNRASAN